MASNLGESLPKRKWIEPVAAVPMAMTTLCTAWCSYQSAAWTRRSNRLLNEYNALERPAALLEVQGSQALIVHTSMFMELLAAQHAGNEKLANFYAERFPPDVKKAYEAWLAQMPFENPNADAHPFVPNLYQVRGVAEAAAVRADAAARVAQAREAGNPDNFSLTPCSSRPCSSPARRGNLNSRASDFPPRSSAQRCSFLPSSECFSCPPLEIFPSVNSQSKYQ